MHQAHQQQNHYIFVLACLNYALLPQARQATGHAAKITEALKLMSLPVQGPVWNALTQACLVKIYQMHEFNTKRDFISELKPLVILRQSQTYDAIGCNSIAASQLVTLISLFGKQALTNKDVVNALYLYATSYRHRSATRSF